MHSFDAPPARSRRSVCKKNVVSRSQTILGLREKSINNVALLISITYSRAKGDKKILGSIRVLLVKLD